MRFITIEVVTHAGSTARSWRRLAKQPLSSIANNWKDWVTGKYGTVTESYSGNTITFRLL